ncbi:MAG: hypothetical protein CVV37_01275 [Nitrospira bacterium HGW-Nitrospira-1]|nr:MAG: hypothetical protein CVV37_01275 [Nitrospira bacterium HGW-Nitrospira-1]
MLAAILGFSLLLQIITIYLSLKLISITKWKSAWLLLALGIVTMGIRRAMIFSGLLTGDLIDMPAVSYELIGLIGSALMLGGVVFVKPIFLSIVNKEREQRELAKKLQDAFLEIKTLSGMIPICASCKKIRDDKGCWHQIEVYVRDHSDAEFTHGLCPDCAKKLYGEFHKA